MALPLPLASEPPAVRMAVHRILQGNGCAAALIGRTADGRASLSPGGRFSARCLPARWKSCSAGKAESWPAPAAIRLFLRERTRTNAPGPVEGSDPQEWWRVLEVNLLEAYLCARAAIPHLKAQGSGKIITIGSGMGQRAYAEDSAYGCSKAGLSMLTRVLAAELWEYGISVNEAHPRPRRHRPEPRRPWRSLAVRGDRVEQETGGHRSPGPLPGHPTGPRTDRPEVQPRAARSVERVQAPG